ncbi:Malonyl-CoA decarboxylase, mitochondrial [Seminavis robusta]|uniref:Malonyl-CoA decarboxylase, mitochondrial n=1 Tax=Seminavis robusta TaxID=568900 RepID=A0A9N8E333_9STRA|nr:Malonyl-CoA decarboxylase, mitochondrial [Seminavis robusta]|eukprot:Sro494_g154320.1 Malonyl-CoA decarboxylase, mitochondrial (605) ;mRNA; f:48978-50792
MMSNISRRRLSQAAIYFLPFSSRSRTAYAASNYPKNSLLFSPAKRRIFRGVQSFSTKSTSNTNSAAGPEVLSALQNLAFRLEEWEPNLSEREPLSSSATSLIASPASSVLQTTDDNSTPVRSIEEYASLFCTGYVQLPPLKLGWNATALASPQDDIPTWECPRSAALLFLAQDCGPPSSTASISTVVEQLQNRHNQQDDNNSTTTAALLLQQLKLLWTPKFEEIFQILIENNSQETLAMLVALRGDLLQLLSVLPKQQSQQSLKQSLMQLENHLRRLLSAWFSPGMLQVRRFTYETTSAGLIEKIAIKEKVHPMKSLDDLRRRLGPRRRVFGLFHPLLPNEPLVILHVHLETKQNDDAKSHIPSTMQHVLQEDDDRTELDSQPTVATFYSISNTQQGLTRGLGLGEFLIKQAVQQLKQEFHSGSIGTFVTLSPMPGFRKWVEDLVASSVLETNEDDQQMSKRLSDHWDLPSTTVEDIISKRPLLEQLLMDTKSGGSGAESIQEQLESLQPTLMHLAAHYLVVAKNVRSGKPLDPVTGFHVHNGAEVFRINYAADISSKGLLRSFGVMVNYRYQLDKIESNKAAFESSHFQDVPMTSMVQDLLLL